MEGEKQAGWQRAEGRRTHLIDAEPVERSRGVLGADPLLQLREHALRRLHLRVAVFGSRECVCPRVRARAGVRACAAEACSAARAAVGVERRIGARKFVGRILGVSFARTVRATC